MLCFTNWLTPSMRVSLGYVLIVIVSIFALYNVIILIHSSCKLFILLVQKVYYRRKSRNLKREVNKITSHIQVNLDDKYIRLSSKPYLADHDLSDNRLD